MIRGIDVVLEIRPTVKSDTRIDGSMSDDIIASLLLPIPPKVLPASSAELIIKNLPSARIETNIIASPGKPAGRSFVVNGTKTDAATAVAKTIYGVALVIHEEVSETTVLFFNSLNRS
jgi:hypothetical protein